VGSSGSVRKSAFPSKTAVFGEPPFKRNEFRPNQMFSVVSYAMTNQTNQQPKPHLNDSEASDIFNSGFFGSDISQADFQSLQFMLFGSSDGDLQRLASKLGDNGVLACHRLLSIERDLLLEGMCIYMCCVHLKWELFIMISINTISWLIMFFCFCFCSCATRMNMFVNFFPEFKRF
jgi:hypothetical protein